MNNDSNLTATEEPTWLAAFGAAYVPIHGYVALTLCIYGMLSNAFAVLIFNRPGMRTPVNVLLTAIAVADSLAALVYTPYAIYFCIVIKCVMAECAGVPYFWITYLLVSNRLMLTFHNISIVLTVALAVVRWLSVCHHIRAKVLCSMERVKLAIGVCIGVCIIISIPTYLEFKVVDFGNGYYWPDYIFKNGADLKHNYFVFHAATIRIFPCILMIGFCIPLIIKIVTANRTRERMLNNEKLIRKQVPKESPSKGIDDTPRPSKREPTQNSETVIGKKSFFQFFRSNRSAQRSHSRQNTTIMLVTVVLFFVAVELPIGVVSLIAGLNQYFLHYVYNYIGELQDDLVLLNAAVNFTLYCLMSAQFRKSCMVTLADLRQHIVCCKFTRRRQESPVDQAKIELKDMNGQGMEENKIIEHDEPVNSQESSQH